jgi:hypothetical protein
MGGLVTRAWYYAHYTDPARRAEHTFLQSRNVLFVGTPHYGSSSTLVALVGGYGNGAAFESLINYVAKDLNDVGASLTRTATSMRTWTSSTATSGKRAPGVGRCAGA